LADETLALLEVVGFADGVWAAAFSTETRTAQIRFGETLT